MYCKCYEMITKPNKYLIKYDDDAFVYTVSEHGKEDSHKLPVATKPLPTTGKH